MNKKQAFAHFNLLQKNPVWSWSAISDDLRSASYFDNLITSEAKLVGITLWVDLMRPNKEMIWRYDNFDKNTELWQHLSGNTHRKEHIQYCIDHCNGLFRTIMLIPEKKGVFDETREIKNAKPFDAAWFKILEFSSITGEFRAESILE